MSLQIGPDTASVLIVPSDPRSLQLTAKLDGKEIQPAEVAWSLLDMDGKHLGDADVDTPLGSVSSAGTYQAPDRPVVEKPAAGSGATGRPHTSLNIRGQAVDETGATVQDTLKVDFKLGWPQEWPYLSDSGAWFQGGRDWSNPLGKRAALVLYDVLLQMPETWHAQMYSLPIIRHELLNRPFHFIFPFPFIMFDEAYFIHPNPGPQPHLTPEQNAALAQLSQSGRGEPATAAEHELGMTFIHEFAHAYMTRKCGGEALFGEALAAAGRVGRNALINLAGIVAFAAAAVGFVYALPIFPALFLYGLHEFGKDNIQSRDLMSEYAVPTGWWTNNLSSLSIPLFGLITAWHSKEPPNAITGLRLVADYTLVNLRNESVNRLSAALTGKETVADLQKALADAEIPSKYACTDPHEDWAEACMIRATGVANVNAIRQARADAEHEFDPSFDPGNGHNVRPVVELESFRKEFLERDYFPPPEVWSNVVFGAALGDYASWEIDYIPQRKLETEIDGADVENLLKLYVAWHDGPAQTVDEVARTVGQIKTEESEPSTIAFLRIAEQHGEGLRRYAKNDQIGEPKDLLIGRDGGMWVVTRTDEEKRILHATGLSTIGPETKPEDFILPREDLNYQWAASADVRVFVHEDSPASEAYGDLEETLRTLVRTWGFEEATAGRREPAPLDGIGPFFAFAMETARIAPPDFPLSDEPDSREVKAFCRTHGDGLRTWEPGDFDVAVGDWVGFYDENLFGVVTRAADGVPVDVLAGGTIPLTAKRTYRDPLEGLPSRAVKLLHIIDPLDVHYVWRPSAELRRLDG